MQHSYDDTIVALATAQGTGAIAMIRVSGPSAITTIDSIFESIVPHKKLATQKSHTVHLGYVKDGSTTLDQVLVSIFKNPNSYTGQDVVEISCHGSLFIQESIIQLINSKGVRLAGPGEFTQRAFLNGKMDLSQAEAVGDLIAAESKAEHDIAMQQMRGGFSLEIKALREELVQFASLIELELDFGEEDVEFADREALYSHLNKIEDVVKRLIDSFAYGNVIKGGVPVAIIGKPNAGKSSLLNMLLNEERAIVSDIAGTTRDSIEDTLVLDGIKFRFIDTAGIRDTSDKIEAIGVKKAKEKAAGAKIILFLFDRHDTTIAEIEEALNSISGSGQVILLVENKIDLIKGKYKNELYDYIHDKLIPADLISEYIAISTLDPTSIDQVKSRLLHVVKNLNASDAQQVTTNVRHKEALDNTLKSLYQVKNGLDTGISGDLLALDIRECLRYLGSITGEIDVDEDILGTIFGKFCIGK